MYNNLKNLIDHLKNKFKQSFIEYIYLYNNLCLKTKKRLNINPKTIIKLKPHIIQTHE